MRTGKLTNTAVVLLALVVLAPAQALGVDSGRFGSLIRSAEKDDSVGVIVALRSGDEQSANSVGRAAVRSVQNRAFSYLAARGLSLDGIRRFELTPSFALDATADDLRALRAASTVKDVRQELVMRPLLYESVPWVGALPLWQQGYDGTGQTIAVLDTGVDKYHRFLEGKVVAEACFMELACPKGPGVYKGAAEPCPGAFICPHGTSVSGVAAGSIDDFSGVARGSSIFAIRVLNIQGAREGDLISGLETTYELRKKLNIAAVNISLGRDRFTTHCDERVPELTEAIERLRSAGVATVVATGNSGLTDRIALPACISHAVSVASVEKLKDRLSRFSDVAPILKLLAPGEDIYTSFYRLNPGWEFMFASGTSFAAPHVAGAFSLLKSKYPGASVDDIERALQKTGVLVTDERPGGFVTTPRIQIDDADEYLSGG